MISHLPAFRMARIGFFVALPLLNFGTTTTFAADTTPSTDSTIARQTHVLFMGADIALEKDRKFHRVEDVTATSLVIKPGGKVVNVPQAQSVNLNISESLKLAETSAGVVDLKADRAYTPWADPFRQVVQSAALASGQSAMADLAQGERMRADMGVATAGGVLEAVRGTPNEGAGRAAVEQAVAARDQAEAAVSQIYNTPMLQIYDVGAQAVEAGAKEMREMFDAIRVSFEVTSEKDLAQPYFAVIAQIRERDSKPGQVRKWAYVKSLGPMSAGVPKDITVYRGGLPPGYILEGCEVHLYNQGQELATNLSRKRVPLTDEEAAEYRIIEYVGANKGRTLPAALVTKKITTELRAQLESSQLKETCYVRVAKDGRVVGVFRDAAGKQSLQDPRLEPVLQVLRFKPALEAGRPAESMVPLTLGQLYSL
jgi:hypothetical protein